MVESKNKNVRKKPAPAARPTQTSEIKGTSAKTRNVVGKQDSLLAALKRLFGLRR